MSTPKLKKDPVTGIQYIHWSDGRRSKRVSTGERDEKNAELFMAHWLLGRRAAPADVIDELAFKHLWATYCERHEVASAVSREKHGRNLLAHFGDLKPSEINSDTVWAEKDGYVVRRERGLIGSKAKRSSIRRELVGLRACLNWCADPKRKLIEKSTVPAFELPEDGEPRDRWLRAEEIQACITAAAEMRRGDRLSRGEIFLWLALETGARKQAILDLTWDRVDFDLGAIQYNVPGRKKTNKRRANPPISPALRPVLERAFAERRNDRVIESSGGIPAALARIGKRAGVKGLTPHVCRHTAATHMARRGVPMWKIGGVLGNSATIVEKVYAKHTPDGLRDAIGTVTPAQAPQFDDATVNAVLEAIRAGKIKVEENQ